MHAGDVQNACRTLNDTAKFLGRIQLETEHDAEAVAQRTGHLTCAGCCADQRKARQVDSYGASRGPLADDDIERVVLHGRIKDLLYRTVETVDLVNKQNIIF